MNLKKTVEQQKKNLDELKAQLEQKEKALVELDKKLKQVSIVVVNFSPPFARRNVVTMSCKVLKLGCHKIFKQCHMKQDWFRPV